MPIENWSRETNHFDLLDGFSLEKSDNKEYANYYSIYDRTNIAFRASYEQQLKVIGNDDSCYWIMKDNKRIGGLLIEPNCMESMFLIPPFRDECSLIKVLAHTLIQWSDKNKEISVFIKQKKYVEYFQRLGFRISGEGRWMIRPTESIDIEWNMCYSVERPDKKDVKELGKMFFEAFSGSPGKKYDIEKRTEFVQYYFEHNSHNDILNNASSIIFDKRTKQIVGACLISEWTEWPLVYDIAVVKEHQGKGIASTMLRYALTILKKYYPALRLYVEAGNSAEALYYNLGFLPGPRVTNMIYPINNL